MIYFWNINRLKSDLVNRPISGKKTLVYLALILAVQGATWIYALSSGEPLNLWDTLDVSGFLLFMILGAGYCRHVNGGSSGAYFMRRYISLAWVFGVQYTVMIAMPAALIFYSGVSMFAGLPDDTQWYDALFNAVIRVPFYITLASHMRDVALNRVMSEQEIKEEEERYEQEFDRSMYPGIMRRYLSTAIDVILVVYALVFLVSMLQGIRDIRPDGMIRFVVLILFFYEPLLTSTLCTAGQKITGIRVRRLDSGERLSVSVACLRSVVKPAIGMISFFFIPVTKKRRALHDFAAGSIVTYKGR